MPNVDRSTTDALIEVESRFPDMCFPMMGLHPTSVNAQFETELRAVEEQLSSHRYFAIGEIGIDLYWDKQWQEQQERAFLIQLTWAHHRNLPVVIHVRNSFEETLKVINQAALPGLRGIFHCFTGTIEQANEVISMGFHLGIGGVATFKNGGLDKVLPFIDPKRIVLETDSPYLAPVPHRGKRNEPSYLSLIVSRVSELTSVPSEELAGITNQNSKFIFGV
jgi:TatD DNase family protein